MFEPINPSWKRKGQGFAFEELFHDGLRNYSSAFEKKFKNVRAG